MTPVEDSIEASGRNRNNIHENGDENPKSNLIKSLNIANAEALEARVRKELEEQGILNPNDNDDNVDNDEILDELKRCQTELKAVSAHNLQQLKRLLKVSRNLLHIPCESAT